MRYLLFVFVMLPLSMLAQAGKGFTITGTITGLPDNSIVYLSGADGKNDTLAKTVASKNSFQLKGKLAATDGIVLILPDLQKSLFLFIGNDDIKLNASNVQLTDVEITGSATHGDYEAFMNEVKPLGDFVNYYRMQVQNAPSEGARDTATIMLNTAYNIYQTGIDRFVNRKKNSPAAALALAYSFDTDPNKDVILLEKRFAALGENAMNSRYAQGVKQAIATAKVGAVGTAAMDFKQKDTAGKEISLSQFKGKYVLIDFWASWCRPCRMENPNVVQAYETFKGKNFTVLSVSLDQEKENWLKAIKMDHLNWTHVSDLQFWNNAVAKLYHVESIPQNFLINPDGIIIAKNLRGEELTSTLQQVLK